jgi:hypothetical protein
VIAADLTSLLLWQYLGILEAVLEAVHRVWLSPNLMFALLNERIAVRFHQPSQVRAAEELRRLVDRDRFTILASMPQPPAWLADEVGLEVAQLLEVAREQGGTLVKPLPIKRARSLGEENADLREYSDLAISAGELARLLHGAGLVDDKQHKDAFGYLVAREESAPRDLPPETLLKPLLIDDLALTYFQQAGILPRLANAGLRLCIHPSVTEDRAVLVMSSQEGELLVEQIDGLRAVLRDAIEKGRAAFLPERAGEQSDGGDERYSLALMLADLFQDAPPYDAIAVDDRNLTRHQFYVDTAGRQIPVVAILDILRYLQERGDLTHQAYFAAIHRLRASGFVLLPLDVAEMQSLLRAVRQWEGDGTIVETAELRVLRQSVARIRALEVVSVESEVRFLESLRLTALLAIKSLWIDCELPDERVEALATWVWRYICPAPWEWVPKNPELAEATAQYICPLLLLLAGVAGNRREVVQNWLEREVLSPILVANPSIASRIGELLGEQIAEFVAANERENSS